MEISDEDPATVFEVLEKLGEGSYGSVYKCRRIEDELIVAVKVVPVDAEYETLQREIEILKACQSQWIVKYHGSYYKDGDFWIVMEYCGAGSVGDMMHICERTMTEDQIASICYGALEGLLYLHSEHKIHRDIKAGNILLDDDGNVKLADFGVSAQLNNTWSKRKSVIGTPFWMAPEVIQQSEYDGKADVWSLGITCIEMADGEPPYADVHPMRAIFMIPSRPPPTLSDTTAWSRDFVDFVTKCLTKPIAERASVKTLLEHAFITRGREQQHQLKEMVLACMEEISEFRANDEDEDSEEYSENDDDDRSESGSDNGSQQLQTVESDGSYGDTMVRASITSSITTNNTVVQVGAEEEEETDVIVKRPSKMDSPTPAFMKQFNENRVEEQVAEYMNMEISQLEKLLEETQTEKDREIRAVEVKYEAKLTAIAQALARR